MRRCKQCKKIHSWNTQLCQSCKSDNRAHANAESKQDRLIYKVLYAYRHPIEEPILPLFTIWDSPQTDSNTIYTQDRSKPSTAQLPT